MTEASGAGDEPTASATSDEPAPSTGVLDQLSEFVTEVVERLAGSRRVNGAEATSYRMEVDADVALLTYLRARWHPVAVPRRGGRKRGRPTRLANPAGSITELANAWAAETGRTRVAARRCLGRLVESGAIVREPSGSGYAWRLGQRSSTHGTVVVPNSERMGFP